MSGNYDYLNSEVAFTGTINHCVSGMRRNDIELPEVDKDFGIGERIYFPVLDEYRLNGKMKDIYKGKTIYFDIQRGSYRVEYDFQGEICALFLEERQMFRKRKNANKMLEHGVSARCFIFKREGNGIFFADDIK